MWLKWSCVVGLVPHGKFIDHRVPNIAPSGQSFYTKRGGKCKWACPTVAGHWANLGQGVTVDHVLLSPVKSSMGNAKASFVSVTCRDECAYKGCYSRSMLAATTTGCCMQYAAYSAIPYSSGIWWHLIHTEISRVLLFSVILAHNTTLYFYFYFHFVITCRHLVSMSVIWCSLPSSYFPLRTSISRAITTVVQLPV